MVLDRFHPLWSMSGGFGVVLGLLGAILGPLGDRWGHVSGYGLFWLLMVVVLVRFGASVATFGAVLGPLGAILARAWGGLGMLLGGLGGVLERSRVNWGDLGATFSTVGFLC